MTMVKETLETYIQKSEELLELLDTLHHRILIADRLVMTEWQGVHREDKEVDEVMIGRSLRALEGIISNVNRSLDLSVALSERNVEKLIRKDYKQ